MYVSFFILYDTASTEIYTDCHTLALHDALPILAEPDLSGPLERIAQHDERFLGEIVGGHHEIGLFVIEHVDLVRVDELRQLERLLRFELDRVDLVLVEQDIFALLVFISFHDLVGIDRADAGRSEEHTSELQSLMRNSYAVFC